MREIRPFYSILVALCLTVFQPNAQAQILTNQNNSAFDACKAQYNAKVSKGYPTASAQSELTQCMSSIAVQQANQDAQQEAEARAAIDEALQQQQQQASQTSSSGSKKSSGSKSNGKSKGSSGTAKSNAESVDDEDSSTESASTRALAQCRASCTSSGYTCQATNNNRTAYTCKLAPGNTTSSDSSGSSDSYVSQCSAEFQKLYEECQAKTEEAVSLCDSENNSGMSQVSKVAQQASLMLGQATSSSVTAACSKAADLSAMANAAVAGFSAYCNSGREGCNDSCKAARTFLKEKGDACFGTSATTGGRYYDQASDKLDDQVKSCDSLASKAGDAQQAIQNYVSTLQNSSQCAALSNSNSSLCAANPRLPGCSTVATECTTTACICAKNPSDPSCTGTSGTGNTITGGIDSSSRLAGNSANNVDMNGDIPSYGIEQGKPHGGSAAGIDGKQGGSSGIGGGGDGAGGMARGGAGGGGEGDPTQVNAGYYGGGGGYGGFGSGSGSGARGGGGVGAQGAGKNGMPNLRAFLPGGKFDPRGVRGIAGATGPDGITGPHTDIWKKVNNRYQVMTTTLLP